MMIFDGEIQIRVSKQNVAFESKFKGLMYYDHNDSSLSPKWCKGLFTTVTFRRCCRYCGMKKCVKYNFEENLPQFSGSPSRLLPITRWETCSGA